MLEDNQVQAEVIIIMGSVVKVTFTFFSFRLVILNKLEVYKMGQRFILSQLSSQ